MLKHFPCGDTHLNEVWDPAGVEGAVLFFDENAQLMLTI